MNIKKSRCGVGRSGILRAKVSRLGDAGLAGWRRVEPTYYFVQVAQGNGTV
jgi:hypothetical protein